MKAGMEKRLQQYRKILKKDPILFEISEGIYLDAVNRDHSMENAASLIVPVYVMAPVMLRYVLWVLDNALKRRQERLYFLARDGYSMYRMAERICREKGLPIECRYLYCSRYAWRTAEYWLKGKESLEHICLGGIDVTFEKIMKRAGLTGEEAQWTAALTGFGPRFSQTLDYRQIRELRPVLEECSFFMNRLICHSRERYPVVMGYLEQEGLLEEVSYAVVDSGWTGSMQKTLVNLLRSKGMERKAEGYYFGMYGYPEAVPKESYHPYYFAPDTAMRRKVYFNNNLFECMFSAPEGMTIGYGEKRGIYVPVLEQKDNPNRDRVLRNIDYLLRYTEGFSQCRHGNGADVKDKSYGEEKNSQKLLSCFMGHPILEEALEFGSYIFCDDVLGEGSQTVAGTLSYEEIKALQLLSAKGRLFRRHRTGLRESAWLEGSTVLEKETNRWDRRQTAWLKYAIYIRKMIK